MFQVKGSCEKAVTVCNIEKRRKEGSIGIRKFLIISIWYFAASSCTSAVCRIISNLTAIFLVLSWHGQKFRKAIYVQLFFPYIISTFLIYFILNILNKNVRNSEVVLDPVYWSTPRPISQAAQVSIILRGNGITPSVTPPVLFTVVSSVQAQV